MRPALPLALILLAGLSNHAHAELRRMAEPEDAGEILPMVLLPMAGVSETSVTALKEMMPVTLPVRAKAEARPVALARMAGEEVVEEVAALPLPTPRRMETPAPVEVMRMAEAPRAVETHAPVALARMAGEIPKEEPVLVVAKAVTKPLPSAALVRMQQAGTETILAQGRTLRPMVVRVEEPELPPTRYAMKPTVAEAVVLARMEDLQQTGTMLARMETEDAGQPVQTAQLVRMQDVVSTMPAESPAERLGRRYAMERRVTEGVPEVTAQKAVEELQVEEARRTLSVPGMETQARLKEEDELLLELRVDGKVTGELLEARQDAAQGVYLPLGEMMRRFGFPIEVLPELGVAQGWFMEEGRTFVLYEREGYVEIAGKRTALPEGSVRREGGELYVKREEMERWFPMALAMQWDDLAIDAKTTEVLPAAARLARQKVWGRYGGPAELPTGPEHELARAMFGWPSLRMDYGMTAGKSGGEGILAQSLNLQGQGNLLGMDSYLAVALQQGAQENAFAGGTFRLSRDSLPGKTLGDTGITHVELGDVTLPRVALANNSGMGQGVSFHNKPVGFTGSLNQFELQGDAPVGWDVEVFQDDSLLAFTTVANNGRYLFRELDLRPGLNDFRIVLYGPQGQKEERRQSYYLGEGMIEPGTWIYEAGLTRTNTPLLGGGDKKTKDGTLAMNSFYGINRNLSLNLGAVRGPLGPESRTQAGVNTGLRATFGRSFTQFDVAGFDEGSMGLAVRERYRLSKDMDIGAFYTRHASTTVDVMQAQSVRGLEFTDSVKLGVPVRYGLTVTDESYAGKPNEQQLYATQSWRMGKMAFSNNLGRRYTPNGNRWDGSDLSFATYMRGMPLRGQILYQPGSKEWINSALMSTQFVLEGNATLNVQGQYQPAAGLLALDTNLQRDLGPLSLGVQGSVRSDNSYQVGVNLGMQLASDGGEAKWRVVPAGGEGLGYGSADMMVFVDDNQNGLRDPDEETLQGVKLRNARTGKESLTNGQGLARMNDLLPNTETLVEVVESSLPDIYLKAASPWHVLLAHQGHGGKVAVPVLRQGEVAGMLLAENPQLYRHARLWLTDANNRMIGQTQAQLDGSFYFQTVPLGRYTLHAESKGGGVSELKDLMLTRQQPALLDLSLKL